MDERTINVTVPAGRDNRSITFQFVEPSMRTMMRIGELMFEDGGQNSIAAVQQEDRALLDLLARNLVGWDGELVDLETGDALEPDTAEPDRFARGMSIGQVGHLAAMLRAGGDAASDQKKDESESPSPSSTD